jgi:subtilisin family serine protease
VKVAPGGEDILVGNGCRLLAQEGDICIANIPIDRLSDLSHQSSILRIEANRGNRLQTDSLAWYLNALPVYEGQALPQAFTGRGVIVGIMDIGFDLTHPNFYSRDTTDYRIRRFWDMLSADTVGSAFPVGRDYAGRDEILAVAHARDGLHQTHGTHTLGIAAGSGYDSKYQGMAPESDLCVVANAVTEDTVYIAPEDYYKYTFATDALGFKYIFDYAKSQDKPCVINFSEGSQQDFWGYDQLYYQMLERISGPGRIIVSAAGNNGNDKTWFRKEPGVPTAGTFYSHTKPTALLTMKGDMDFDIRLVAYSDEGNDTLLTNTSFVTEQKDSVLSACLCTYKDTLQIIIEAYPSCYIASETCYDLTFKGKKNVGINTRLSIEIIGVEADVEVYRVDGNLVTNSLNPLLAEGEKSHSVLSPATAPCVICVGATNYRPGIVNYKGVWKRAGTGIYGERNAVSAVGPTMDGRTKPDVMAPGLNIISSYSSYYLENHPGANDISWDVAHFDFNGRTYAWNSNSGTSMSSPAVAGAIALWLQACPTLTTEQVLDVFSHTCRHYDEELTYPNNYYGYGEIDVYRGLLYLLGADNIEGVSHEQTKARVDLSMSTDGSRRLLVKCDAPLSASATLRLFSLSGKMVFATQLAAGQQTHTINLPSLHEGIYAAQIDGPQQISGSLLLKIEK